MLACEQALPVWASETGLARTRERAAKPRGADGPSLARSREARFACPNRRACSKASLMQAATLLKYDISHWFPRDAGGRKYGLVITELYNQTDIIHCAPLS